MALLTGVYRKKPRDERFWILSPVTLRKRFATLQRALGLPLKRSGRLPYDLASLRAGGATLLLQRFGDSELVRHQGRWVASRVYEIYLGGFGCNLFRSNADSCFSEDLKISRLAEVFPAILTKALFLLETLGPGCLDKLEKDRGAAEAQSPGMGRGREHRALAMAGLEKPHAWE